jgi:hypothetical protein
VIATCKEIGIVMNEKEINRFYLSDFDNAVDPHWALFLREKGRKSGRSAFFQCLVDSKESAVEIARQYASEQAQRGNVEFAYYVVELKHQVGIKGGKIVDMDI